MTSHFIYTRLQQIRKFTPGFGTNQVLCFKQRMKYCYLHTSYLIICVTTSYVLQSYEKDYWFCISDRDFFNIGLMQQLIDILIEI